MNPLWAVKYVYYLWKIIPIVDEMGVKVKLDFIILSLEFVPPIFFKVLQHSWVYKFSKTFFRRIMS